MSQTRLERLVEKYLSHTAGGYENEVLDGHREICDLPTSDILENETYLLLKEGEGIDVRRSDRFLSNAAVWAEIEKQVMCYKWDLPGAGLVVRDVPGDEMNHNVQTGHPEEDEEEARWNELDANVIKARLKVLELALTLQRKMSLKPYNEDHPLNPIFVGGELTVDFNLSDAADLRQNVGLFARSIDVLCNDLMCAISDYRGACQKRDSTKNLTREV